MVSDATRAEEGVHVAFRYNPGMANWHWLVGVIWAIACTTETTTQADVDGDVAGAAGVETLATSTQLASTGGATSRVPSTGGAVAASGGASTGTTLAEGEIAVRECLLVMQNGCGECELCATGSVDATACLRSCAAMLRCWAVNHCGPTGCPSTVCNNFDSRTIEAARTTVDCSCS